VTSAAPSFLVADITSPALKIAATSCSCHSCHLDKTYSGRSRCTRSLWFPSASRIGASHEAWQAPLPSSPLITAARPILSTHTPRLQHRESESAPRLRRKLALTFPSLQKLHLFSIDSFRFDFPATNATDGIEDTSLLV
jgi:hypothetical protein